MKIHGVILGSTLFIGISGTAWATLCVDPAPGNPLGSQLFTTALGNVNNAAPPLAQALSIQYADVDGDGDDDVCNVVGNTVTCRTHHSNPICSNGICQTVPDPCFGFGNHSYTVTFPFDIAGTDARWKTLAFPDLDNDEDKDVCVRGTDGVYCALAGASNFGAATRWSTSFGENNGWGVAKYYETVTFPDVNNDDRADVCGRAADGIHCATSINTAFSASTRWTTLFSDALGWGSSASHFQTVQFADIDADGDDDVCGRATDGIHCALSNHVTRAFEADHLWTAQFANGFGWSAEKYYGTIQFADVNGDLMADVCGRGGGGVYCGISYGAGSNGFVFDQAFVLAAPEFSDANGWDQPQHYRTVVLADANGDGNADICGRASDGVYCAPARTFWQGFVTGWTDLFNPLQLWTSNFGDNNGWGASETHWGTVKPANVVSGWAGVEFCGRGSGGIWCSHQ